MSRDADGNREYELDILVKRDSVSDGPFAVLSTPALPLIGSAWSFGNDFDGWAYCTPEVSIAPYKFTDEPNYYWKLGYKFSTKSETKRCQEATIEDPLLEPQNVSGSFNISQRLTEKDRNGTRITNSNKREGIKIEVDTGNPTVTIEQNVASLGLSSFAAMVQTVNDRELWGLAKRKIKLSSASWQRKMYGVCSYYYTRRFEFEVKYDGWDYTDIVDKGRYCLRGSWSKEKDGNGAHTWTQDPLISPTSWWDFNGDGYLMLAKSPEDEPEECLLDGSGGRWADVDNPKFITAPEVYGESNFLLLGIPTVF
jgi:hypothetical protein